MFLNAREAGLLDDTVDAKHNDSPSPTSTCEHISLAVAFPALNAAHSAPQSKCISTYWWKYTSCCFLHWQETKGSYYKFWF